MAGITNVNGNVDVNLRKVTGKLSFEIGQVFLANVEDMDEVNDEVSLKLPDGWKFTAKLLKPLNFSMSGLTKFQVIGLENGEIQIQVVNDKDIDKTNDNDSIDFIAKELNISVNEDDYSVLEKMVKHDIPLTKENISEVKTLLDFKGKITQDEGEEDNFINNYLENRNINKNSSKGVEVQQTLKDFFEALKDTSTDVLLTFKENNIQLSAKNIKSFNRIFYGSSTIYNEVKSFEQSEPQIGNRVSAEYKPQLENNAGTNSHVMSNDNIMNDSDMPDTMDSDNIMNDSDIPDTMDSDNIINNLDVSDIIDNDNIIDSSDIDIMNDSSEVDNFKEIETPQELNESDTVNNTLDTEGSNASKNTGTIVDYISKEDLKQSTDNTKSSGNIDKKPLDNNNHMDNNNHIKGDPSILSKQDNSTENVDDYVGEKSDRAVSQNSQDASSSDTTVHDTAVNQNADVKTGERIGIKPRLTGNKIDSPLTVKNELNLKTEKMKETIKNTIENIKHSVTSITDEKNLNNIINSVKNSINDFKVFNTVSNAYYYADLPVEYLDNEYQCKLIIKDDRKNGKKIDTKNVKMAISVKTINMGVVDSYINVKDNAMNIDILCDKKWIKIMDYGKEKVKKALSDTKYNVFIKVDEKKKEVNLVNCRDFFEDNRLGSINVRV